MTKRMRGVAIVAGAALSIAAVYASANYILNPAVQDSGGGHADSAGYQIDASVGGPVIAPVAAGGEAASANYSVQVNSVQMLSRSPASPAPPVVDDGGCLPGGSTGSLALPLLLAALLLVHRGARAPRAQKVRSRR